MEHINKRKHVTKYYGLR